MASESLNESLDECLNMMRAGVSIDDCVARHPMHAEELRPQLEMAQTLRSNVPQVPQPSSGVQAQSRQRLLTAAGQSYAAAADGTMLAPLRAMFARVPRLAQALPAVIAMLILGGAAWGVSAATGNPDPTSPIRSLFASHSDPQSCAELSDLAEAEACAAIVAGVGEACTAIANKPDFELCEEAIDAADQLCDELSDDAERACENELDTLNESAEAALHALEEACEDLEDEAAQEACEDALDPEEEDGHDLCDDLEDEAEEEACEDALEPEEEDGDDLCDDLEDEAEEEACEDALDPEVEDEDGDDEDEDDA